MSFFQPGFLVNVGWLGCDVDGVMAGCWRVASRRKTGVPVKREVLDALAVPGAPLLTYSATISLSTSALAYLTRAL